MQALWNGLWRFLCSVKLAVLVILSLAGSLAVGTVLESLHDTPTAQYYVYRSLWFHGILAMLGLQITSVAIDRFPWKKRHIPFLLAHLGIIILLTGAWLTERFGLDGSLRITEGETSAVVELEQSNFVVSDRAQVYTVPVPWIPTGVKFDPIRTREHKIPYDVTVDQYLTHADPVYSFIPAVNSKPERAAMPAVHVQIAGGPMRIKQDYWLWAGEKSWARLQAGPSLVTLGEEPIPRPGRPSLGILPGKNGAVALHAISSAGKRVEKNFDKPTGAVFDPGWKGNVQITILEVVPNASLKTTYKASRLESGKDAPPAAIHVVAMQNGVEAESWLGMGERSTLHLNDSDVDLGFFPQRLILPFSIHLEQFAIEHNEGTNDPASYSSRVTAHGKDGKVETVISMNEPLVHSGVTFYQASYEDAQPRPVTSILQVNRDPGRFWKYLGSLLIVFGSISLFASRARKAKAAKKQEAAIMVERTS